MAIDLSKYGEPLKGKAIEGLDLSKYGTPVDFQEAPKEDGFFTSVYKSLFAPVANLIARPGQAVQSALGQEPSTGKFLGLDITAPQTAMDVLKDVGRGLETVAVGVTGGGSSILKAGLKQGIKAGVKEGAIIGAKSSPLLGAGQSLTGGETDIRQILKDTAVSTAIGIPTTAVLGGIVPGVGGIAKQFTKKNAQEELGTILRDTGAKYVKPQAILEKAEQISKTDPIGVLQMYGKNIVPDMKGGGADTTEAQAFLKKKISELSTLRNEDLFLSNERVPLQGYRKYAEELVDAQNWSDSKKQVVKNDVAKIFNEMDATYAKSPKNVNGIELQELNTLKTEQTGLSKSYNNKAPRFDYDAHGIAGKAARDLIELLTDSDTTKELNKLIQSHYDAIDFMDAINGKKVQGGNLSKLGLKIGGNIIGAVAGSASGNPIIGGVAGNIIAGKISDIIQSNFITNPIKRLLINNLKEQSPKEVQRALKTLELKYKTAFDEIFPKTSGVKLPTTNKPVSVISRTGKETKLDLGDMNQDLSLSKDRIPSAIQNETIIANKIPITESVLPTTESVKGTTNPAYEKARYELSEATAGKRVFTPQQNESTSRVTGVPSTFPKWLPEEVRSKTKLDAFLTKYDKGNYFEKPDYRAPVSDRKIYDALIKENPDATVKPTAPEIDFVDDILKKMDESKGNFAIGAGVSAGALAEANNVEVKTGKSTTTIPVPKKDFPFVPNNFIKILVDQESSNGKDKKNEKYDQGKYGYLVGFTKDTYKDIVEKAKTQKRYKNLLKNIKFDTPEQAIRSATAYANHLMRDFGTDKNLKDGTTPKKIDAIELYKRYNGNASPNGVLLFAEKLGNLTNK